MVTHFPVVVEREQSGVFSAYVIGLPVYAQGASEPKAEQAIRRTLAAYLEAHPETKPSSALVKVAAVLRPIRLGGGGKTSVILKSVAALIGRKTSARKAAAARANGRLGGRPRLAAGRRVAAKR